MVTFGEIEKFIQAQTAIASPVAPTDRLEEDLGITGDDYFELIDDFSKHFDVNVDGFLWYFHCHEEVFCPGGMFFPPPSRQVKRIAITAKDLLHFAITKKWDVVYPPHTLAKRRYDHYITWVLYLSPLLIMLLLNLLPSKCTP